MSRFTLVILVIWIQVGQNINKVDVESRLSHLSLCLRGHLDNEAECRQTGFSTPTTIWRTTLYLRPFVFCYFHLC